MKQADVQVGGVYLTRISGELRPVEVVFRHERTTYGHRRYLRHGGTVTRTVFKVRKAYGDWAPLPKSRTAAALRPLES